MQMKSPKLVAPKRLLIWITIAAWGLIVPAHSQFDQTKFDELLKTKEYDAAWRVIEQIESTADANIYWQKGILLGTGVLSSGFDRCRAIHNLEKAQDMGALYVRSSLDFLYRGDWVGIAALEGNAFALLEVGFRLETQKSPMLVFDLLRGVKESRRYYMKAAEMGNATAKRQLKEINRKHPKLGPLTAAQKTPFVFKKVLCPVRVSK